MIDDGSPRVLIRISTIFGAVQSLLDQGKPLFGGNIGTHFVQKQRTCFCDGAVFSQEFIYSGLAGLPDDRVINARRMRTLVIEAVAPPEKFSVLVVGMGDFPAIKATTAAANDFGRKNRLTAILLMKTIAPNMLFLN